MSISFSSSPIGHSCPGLYQVSRCNACRPAPAAVGHTTLVDGRGRGSQFLGLGDEVTEDLLSGLRIGGQPSDQAGQVGAGNAGELAAQVRDIAWWDAGRAEDAQV